VKTSCKILMCTPQIQVIFYWPSNGDGQSVIVYCWIVIEQLNGGCILVCTLKTICKTMFIGLDGEFFSIDESTGVISTGSSALSTMTYHISLRATGEDSAPSEIIYTTITVATTCSNIFTTLVFHYKNICIQNHT